MTVQEKHYLHKLFHPKAVAIIGASERAESVGRKVMTNMLKSQFKGGLYPVNPKHKRVFGKPCFASIKQIRKSIDLAVITTPARTVPDILKECGEKGIRTAIIITAGFSEMGDAGKALEQKIREIAQHHKIRFIGPNCLGVMRPDAKLNATFDNNNAQQGSIALLSQSGAICAGILDWAVAEKIGFSTIVSMGNSIDLDFGDVLEYLAVDKATKSILLYIEGIHYSQRFIKGLRAASKHKPVIAIKAGRNSAGGRAVHSHTGALVGDDDVFSAALARGGAIRVNSIQELFIAAEILSSNYKVKDNRLTIVTNGGGAGVMAADRAAESNLVLPNLSNAMVGKLNKVLPPQWSHQNPIDIIGDATPERYRKVVDLCLNDKNSDALLTILVPIAMTKPFEVAKELVRFAKDHKHKPLITCWMGEKQVESSHKLFSDKKIPCYRTPELAVRAFAYLADYHKNQKLLAQEPKPYKSNGKFNVAKAEKIIANALKEKRTILTTIESKAILQAFAIPVSKTLEALSKDEAVAMAKTIGFPIVMKISSPDITHKQDVGGVMLNIKDEIAVANAYKQIIQNVKKNKPTAKITGITLERMFNNTNYRELMLGVTHDKVFGPAIAFGMGGSLVEVIKDRAIALPPLNKFLASELIAQTKASKLLGEFRGKPAVNMDALIDAIIGVSNLVSELPQVMEMDINPILVDDKEAIVVDARFVVAEVKLVEVHKDKHATFITN